MYTKTSTWANKSATGAGSTAIITAASTAPDQYKSIWITGINADVIGLGTGEYSKIGCGASATTTVLYTETNGFHTVDYQGTSGLAAARLAGPASTGLYLVRTGSSNRSTVSVGYFLSE